MTPEEHFMYAQSLLKGCEQMMEVDHAAAASQAILAQSHFAAANAGAVLRGWELLRTQVVAEVPPPSPVEGDDPAVSAP